MRLAYDGPMDPDMLAEAALSETASGAAGVVEPVFGRVITAMVTPFRADGSLDLDTARRLARRLVDEQRNDALVVNGTTGESPTTSDDEKRRLVEAVSEEVGDRAQVVAGVGTFSTAHTIELAGQATAAGADGLLVVTPYYSRPPAERARLPFPRGRRRGRCADHDLRHPAPVGCPVDTATFLAIADHPNIVAVKDAKGQLVASSRVIAETNLTYYAGDDAITLPLLSVGGAGVVGTATHFTGRRMREMIDAFVAGTHRRGVGAAPVPAAGDDRRLRHPGRHARQGRTRAPRIPRGGRPPTTPVGVRRGGLAVRGDPRRRRPLTRSR